MGGASDAAWDAAWDAARGTTRDAAAFSLDLAAAGSIEIECVENGPLKTNTYFARSAGEVLVIDPAWDGEALAAGLAARHPGDRVVGICCTHGHADHLGGVAGMRRALGPGVPFMLPADDVPTVAESIASQRVRFHVDTPDPGRPDRLLHEGDVVAVGDARLQVVAVPGHTPGGIILFCACGEGRYAFVGDTLFPRGHGKTTLVGGDPAAMERSLAKIARVFPPDTVCLIGHGPSTVIGRELEENRHLRRAAGLD